MFSIKNRWTEVLTQKWALLKTQKIPEFCDTLTLKVLMYLLLGKKQWKILKVAIHKSSKIMLKLKHKIIYGEKYARSPFTHISLDKGRSLREDPINRHKPECAQYFWGKGSLLNIIMFKIQKSIFTGCYTLWCLPDYWVCTDYFFIGQHTVIQQQLFSNNYLIAFFWYPGYVLSEYPFTNWLYSVKPQKLSGYMNLG